jgi:hypothetical protein
MSLDSILQKFAANFGTSVSFGGVTYAALTDSVEPSASFLPDGFRTTLARMTQQNAAWADTRSFSFSPADFDAARAELPMEGQTITWLANGDAYTVVTAVAIPFMQSTARWRVVAYRVPQSGVDPSNPGNENTLWGGS